MTAGAESWPGRRGELEYKVARVEGGPLVSTAHPDISLSRGVKERKEETLVTSGNKYKWLQYILAFYMAAIDRPIMSIRKTQREKRYIGKFGSG